MPLKLDHQAKTSLDRFLMRCCYCQKTDVPALKFHQHIVTCIDRPIAFGLQPTHIPVITLDPHCFFREINNTPLQSRLFHPGSNTAVTFHGQSVRANIRVHDYDNITATIPDISVKFERSQYHEDRFFVLNEEVEEINHRASVRLRVGDTIKFYADNGIKFVVGVMIELV
jgi:hypothetical protein